MTVPTHITGIPWLDAVLVAMGAWGYLVTFLGGAAENLFLAGGVVPGETIVMAVSFVASVDPRLMVAGVWLASVTGTVAGSTVSYWIGRQGGRPLLARVSARFPRVAKGLHDAEEYFEIHGTKTIFIARFTAGFKNFVPFLAGVTHMRQAPFQGYTVLAASLYSTILVVLGYLFGSNLDTVAAWLKRAGVGALVAVALAVAAWVAYRRLVKRRIRRQVDAHEAIHETHESGERGRGADGEGQ